MNPIVYAQQNPRRRTGPVVVWGLACGLSCWLACLAAAAAESDGAKAEVLFQEGKALLDAGQIDEACNKLDASWQLEQAPGTLLNLAVCHGRQGRTATAWAELVRAADMSHAAGNEARAAGARKLAQEMERRLSRLALRLAEPIAPRLVVVIDQRELPSHAVDSPLPLDPGRHVVEARAPGHANWRTEIEIVEGRRDIELRVPVLAPAGGPAAAADAPERASSWVAPAGWIGIGVGVVGLAIGAGLGVHALQSVSDAEQDPALCPNKRCTSEGRAALDSAEALGNGATAALVAGGTLVALGAAALMATLDAKSAAGPAAAAGARATAMTAFVGPNAMGLGLRSWW